MKLYTLTLSELERLVYAVDVRPYDMPHHVLQEFLDELNPPTRELSPAMTAQYSRQNTGGDK